MSEQQIKVSRQPWLAIAILGAGAVGYAYLCQPAISRRGFPPIDHFWMAMPYLWIGPVALSALFDRGVLRNWTLFVYALFTAFVHAGTQWDGSPRYMTGARALSSMWFDTAPFHVIIGFLVNWIVHVLSGIKSKPAAEDSSVERRVRFTLRQLLLATLIIALTAAFPAAYRDWTLASEHARGRMLAAEHWKNQDVEYYDDEQSQYIEVPPDTLVWFGFEPTTGFPYGPRRTPSEFKSGYRERIDELLCEYGVPAWSLKSLLIEPQALIDLLDSTSGTEITSLPFDVTPSIVVFKTGTVSKWGATFTVKENGAVGTTSNIGGSIIGTGDAIAIATEQHDLWHVGAGQRSISVIDLDNSTVAIRYGDNWIGIFHRDGRLLQSACRPSTF